jgi:hypothetical protein
VTSSSQNSLGRELDAFYLEHRACGDLRTGITNTAPERVWLTCSCGARIEGLTLLKEKVETMLRAVVAVAVLLGAVPTASAECAWVLWREEEMKIGTRVTADWATPLAYPNQHGCVGAIHDNITRIERERDWSITRAASGTAVEFRTRTEDGNWSAVRLHCLPDTIDPRGPKGGVAR